MDTETLSALLRSAPQDDVTKALEGASIDVPLTSPTELLEFFHRMIDVLIDAGKDAEIANRNRIPPGFGSTG